MIQELNSKQRKIPSFRGFFLYVLEIMENGKDYEILKTNLQPFFWRKVKTIIRQNQKGALLEFLFGKDELNQDQTLGLIPHLEDQIQTLQNQVDSLQQKIIQLENNQPITIKKALSNLLKRSEASKIDQQADYTLKPEQSPPEVSYTSTERSENYNLSSNTKQAQNEHNSITLGKISEQEKIEIIQIGFQRQAEGKISLKKYYESTKTHSLFQLKGYNIKYESIRRTNFFKQFRI